MSIQKPDAGWWRGDYGGLKSHWFPANFTRLEEHNESLDDTTDSLESPDNLERGERLTIVRVLALYVPFETTLS